MSDASSPTEGSTSDGGTTGGTAGGVKAPKAVDRMAAAATAFLQSLEPERRAAAATGFDAPDRRDWTYLPGPRAGLALLDMTPRQRELAMELLDSALSARGAATARSIMELEEILRVLEQDAGKAAWERRHRQHFWFRVHGTPGGTGASGGPDRSGEPGMAEPWGWKVGGHHLLVQATIVGDRVAAAPQFFGANPARVPDTHDKAGLRTLPDEEDVARRFLAALTPSQRELAIGGWIAPDDILTRADPVADTSKIPHGLYFHHMHGEHKDLLVQLIRQYLDRMDRQIADTAWTEIEAAGLDNVSFRWSGSTEAEPGHGHYYAVLGPTFLLEYDNVQNDANHIHTVWRDLRHDWGDDLLAEHYADHPH